MFPPWDGKRERPPTEVSSLRYGKRKRRREWRGCFITVRRTFPLNTHSTKGRGRKGDPYLGKKGKCFLLPLLPLSTQSNLLPPSLPQSGSPHNTTHSLSLFLIFSPFPPLCQSVLILVGQRKVRARSSFWESTESMFLQTVLKHLNIKLQACAF